MYSKKQKSKNQRNKASGIWVLLALASPVPIIAYIKPHNNPRLLEQILLTKWLRCKATQGFSA